MIYSDIFRCTANHRRIDELHTFVSMMPGRPDWSDICSAAPFQAVSPAPIQSVYFAGYLRQVVFMFDKLDKRDAVEISARLMERFKASTACVTSSKDIPLEAIVNLLVCSAQARRIDADFLYRIEIPLPSKAGCVTDQEEGTTIGKSFLELRFQHDKTLAAALGDDVLCATLKVKSFTRLAASDRLPKFHNGKKCVSIERLARFELRDEGTAKERMIPSVPTEPRNADDLNLFVRRQMDGRRVTIPWFSYSIVLDKVKRENPALAEKLMLKNMGEWGECRLGILGSAITECEHLIKGELDFEQTSFQPIETIDLAQLAPNKRLNPLRTRLKGMHLNIEVTADKSRMVKRKKKGGATGTDGTEEFDIAAAQLERLPGLVEKMLAFFPDQDRTDTELLPCTLQVVNDKTFDKADTYRKPAAGEIIQHIEIGNLPRKRDCPTIAESLCNELAKTRSIVCGDPTGESWPGDTGAIITIPVHRVRNDKVEKGGSANDTVAPENEEPIDWSDLVVPLEPNSDFMPWISAEVLPDGTMRYGVQTPSDILFMTEEDRTFCECAITLHPDTPEEESFVIGSSPAHAALDLERVRSAILGIPRSPESEPECLDNRTNAAFSDILHGMLGIQVLFKDEKRLLYSVGGRKGPSAINLPRGQKIREVRALYGAKVDDFMPLVKSMDAKTIRLGQASVLPWPVNYLRRYAELADLVPKNVTIDAAE